MTKNNYVHLLVSVIHPEYEMTTNRYCVGFSLEDQRLRDFDIDRWAETAQRRKILSLLCLHPTPGKLSILLEYLADEVERRGDIDYDRDPGETADWLRDEAAVALNANNFI